MAEETNKIKELIQQLSQEVIKLRATQPESIKKYIQDSNFESFLNNGELQIVREFWAKFSKGKPVNNSIHTNLMEIIIEHRDELNAKGFNDDDLLHSLAHIPPLMMAQIIK